MGVIRIHELVIQKLEIRKCRADSLQRGVSETGSMKQSRKSLAQVLPAEGGSLRNRGVENLEKWSCCQKKGVGEGSKLAEPALRKRLVREAVCRELD